MRSSNVTEKDAVLCQVCGEEIRSLLIAPWKPWFDRVCEDCAVQGEEYIKAEYEKQKELNVV